ncbi:MAG: metallophosphoesterase [Clostridiales bacterium]|nr:metallophosphoesterase [Clostridiales bacterium]
MAKRHQGLSFSPSKKRRIWPIFLGVFLFLLLVLSSVFFINTAANRRVQVENVSVPILGLEKDLEGFTILHISDLHGAFFGENQQFLYEALLSKPFHAVCITGDMLGENDSDSALISLIEKIRLAAKDVPIYFVPGDEDPVPVKEHPEAPYTVFVPYMQKLKSLHVVYVDVPVPLQVKNTTLWFMPKSQYAMNPELLYSTYESQKTLSSSQANTSVINYYMDQMQRMITARKQMKEEDYQIILSHYPLTQSDIVTWSEVAKDPAKSVVKGILLSLSGHYNAGQWRIPIINKALFVPGKGFFPPDEGVVGPGLVSSVFEYISPGLGSSSFYPFPGRIFNTPTISYVTLTGKQ